MTKFCALVFGEDLQRQLAPFGAESELEPHWEVLAHHVFEYPSARFWAANGRLGVDATWDDLLSLLRKDSETQYRVMDGHLEELTTERLHYKWDAWRVAGDDSLLLCIGERSDSAEKADIDFTRMRVEAQAGAAKTFDRFLKAVDGLSSPGAWVEFSAPFLGELAGTYQRALPQPDYLEYKARNQLAEDAWERHPFNRAIRKADLWPFFDNGFDPHLEFCLDQSDPRGAFLKSAADNVVQVWASVRDGVWADAEGQSSPSWGAQLWAEISSAPNGMRLTVVNCHR